MTVTTFDEVIVIICEQRSLNVVFVVSFGVRRLLLLLLFSIGLFYRFLWSLSVCRTMRFNLGINCCRKKKSSHKIADSLHFQFDARIFQRLCRERARARALTAIYSSWLKLAKVNVRKRKENDIMNTTPRRRRRREPANSIRIRVFVCDFFSFASRFFFRFCARSRAHTTILSKMSKTTRNPSHIHFTLMYICNATRKCCVHVRNRHRRRRRRPTQTNFCLIPHEWQTQIHIAFSSRLFSACVLFSPLPKCSWWQLMSKTIDDNANTLNAVLFKPIIINPHNFSLFHFAHYYVYHNALLIPIFFRLSFEIHAGDCIFHCEIAST